MSNKMHWLLELREEMAKLNSPSSATVDPKYVANLCERLNRSEAKDLRVDCYLLWAKLKDALDTLDNPPQQQNQVLNAIEEMCLRLESTDGFDPPRERERARRSLGRWLTENLGLLLLNERNQCSAHELNERLARLAMALGRHGMDEPGAFESLRGQIVGRQVAIQAPPPSQRHQVTQSAPRVLTQSPEQPPRPNASSQQEHHTSDRLDLWQQSESLLPVALHHIRLAPQNPDTWHLYLTHLWLGVVDPPPSTDGKTRIAKAPPSLTASLTSSSREDFERLLVPFLSEHLPRYRLELALFCRLAQALDEHKMQASARAIRNQARALCVRIEGLKNLCCDKGTPLCDANCLKWLSDPTESTPPKISKSASEVKTSLSPIPFDLLCSQLAALTQLAQGAYALAQSPMFKEPSG